MGIKIDVRIDELLEKRDRSFYWLSKQTGVSYTTLWRLKKGKALGINFATLIKLCIALDCTPGDVMTLKGSGKAVALKPTRTERAGQTSRRRAVAESRH
jgi:putative transcriptional regulator